MQAATYFYGGWNEINKRVVLITPDNSHRYTTVTNLPLDRKLGNSQAATHTAQMDLIRLTQAEMEWLEDLQIPVKRNEIICRYRTATTMAGGIEPLIKINVDKMLCYFMVDNERELEFMTRGTKLGYLNIIDGDKFIDE